jgi:hypothetical protein
MKKIVIIIASIKSIFLIKSYIGVSGIVMNWIVDIYTNSDEIKNGDSNALNNMIDIVTEDSVNLIVYEGESIPQDILLDELDVKIKE